MSSINDNNNMIYEVHPISDVELLGHAKNNIVEVMEMSPCLPFESWEMLRNAYNWLDKVQELLFNN